MADSVTLNPGVGGSVFYTEDISGVGTLFMAVSKIHTGGIHGDGGPVTTANPFPVSATIAGTIAGLASATISGALPTGTNTIGAVTIGGEPTWNLNQVGGTGIALGPVGKSLGVPIAFPTDQMASIGGTVSVGNFPATQPVSAASLPLPTGAATATNQPGIGTAGTANANVLTVQGIASMTPIAVSGGVAITGMATGGASMFHLVAAATTNATAVKTSPGTVKGIQVYNVGATPAYLKIYDIATTLTPGTGTPKKVVMIPGNTAGSGATVPLPPEGLGFLLGIAFSVTGGIADNDATSVSASSIIVELDYK